MILASLLKQKNQHRLAEPVAGPIASVQEQLKKSMVEDNLKNKLAARPALNELVEQNILKGTGEDGLNAVSRRILVITVTFRTRAWTIDLSCVG